MPSRHHPFAAAVVTICSAFLAVPAAAQEAGRGWTLTAGGGYATQLDPGSSNRGSLSFGASALRSLSRTVSLGVEGGYDRHEAFEEGGQVWWNGTNVTSSECPGACPWQRVRFTQKYVGAAWHLGGLLRYTFSPARALVPSAEFGVGLYGIRNQSARQTRDATTDAPVPELSSQGGSTDWAPGVSGALGVDLFPGNGRIGVGAVARLRLAGRPADGQLLGIGFASLQARVTIR
jgi:opacity protein-like surface antigen